MSQKRVTTWLGLKEPLEVIWVNTTGQASCPVPWSDGFRVSLCMETQQLLVAICASAQLHSEVKKEKKKVS